MAHTIYVGNVAKRKNSTLQPTLTTSFDVLLKTPTSLHTPTFTINTNSFDYNYLKWDDRYYFITDVVSRNNNLWEVSAIIDVLATYKAEILASTQYVCYSSVSGGSFVCDTRIPLKTSETVAANSALTGVLSTIGCYILTAVGVNSVCSYMYTSEYQLAALLEDLQTWTDNAKNAAQAVASAYQASADSGSVDTTDSYVGIAQTLHSCLNAISSTIRNLANAITNTTKTISDALTQTGFYGNAYENATDCIRSCIWVPFDSALMPAGTSGGPMHLGTYPVGSHAGAPISPKPVTNSFTINIPWQHSDWRRKVCEEVYLYLPLVGMVQLSTDSLTSESTLTISWSVTYTDGVIAYKVKAGSQVVGAFSGQCAVNYPVGVAQQASAGQVVSSAIQGIQKTVSAGIKGGISSGVVSGILSAYDTIDTANSTHISTVGNVGGGAGLGLGREAVCYTVSHDTVIPPADMVATMGQPTMKPLVLSSCTGYCQCANAHVSAAAESQELDAIDAYLNSGFYIE